MQPLLVANRTGGAVFVLATRYGEVQDRPRVGRVRRGPAAATSAAAVTPLRRPYPRAGPVGPVPEATGSAG